MYRKMFIYGSSELRIIKQMISNHLSAQINLTLEDIGNYHTYVSDKEHSEYSHKNNRVFSKTDVGKFLALNGTQKIIEEFPDFELSNVLLDNSEEPREEVYFRIVRPNKNTDVGQPHCDRWFHEASSLKYTGLETWKVWISIEVENGLNGLAFYPNADYSRLKYEFSDSQGVRRPSLVSNDEIIGKPALAETVPGDVLIFSDDVLHAGLINQGNRTRVSIEITFVPKVY
jgi:hypothetical protein